MAKEAVSLFGHLPQALGVVFQKMKSLVPTSRASWRCPWLPGWFCNMLLTPLAFLTGEKGDTTFPLLWVMPTFSLLLSFLPSLLFCDIYLAGQKDTYSLPPGTSNHTPPPQSISVAPHWLLRTEASSLCWSLTTHATTLSRVHGRISRVQNLCLQIPVLRAPRSWVKIYLSCLLKAELEREDLVRLYGCLNKNGS